MAGFFGFFDYSKPGRGVEKEEFKPNISTFFRILTTRLWKLIQLNMLYFICSLPLIAVYLLFLPLGGQEDGDNTLNLFRFCFISLMLLSVVGIPPFITGFVYVLRNFSSDRHSWVMSDFFEQIKKNFKQASLLLLIDAAVAIVFPTVYHFYTGVISSGGASLVGNIAFIARTFVTVVVVVYFIMHFYIYQIMVTFDLKLKQILKNAFIFTFVSVFRNIGILILISAISFITFGFSFELGILISFLVSPSLIGYIISFTTQPVISRYMVPAEVSGQV